jgi:hypothetical protein
MASINRGLIKTILVRIIKSSTFKLVFCLNLTTHGFDLKMTKIDFEYVRRSTKHRLSIARKTMPCRCFGDELLLLSQVIIVVLNMAIYAYTI